MQAAEVAGEGARWSQDLALADPARGWSAGTVGRQGQEWPSTKEAMTLPGSPREGTEAAGPRKPAVAVPTPDSYPLQLPWSGLGQHLTHTHH